MNFLEQMDNLTNMSMKDDWDKMVTGKAILNPEQQLTFLRPFTTVDPLQTLARMVMMNNPSRQSSSFRIQRRASQHGYTTGHTTKTQLREAVKEFEPIEINTTKIKALTSVTDDELEEGIERGNYSNTILSEMGQVMGEDNVYWNVFGDTTISSNDDDLLCAGDGWLKLTPESNQLQSSEAASSGSGDFDLGNGVEAMFDALRQKLPAGARNRNLVYLAPYEVEDAYRNSQIGRYTPLGDSRLEGYDGLKYKGIPVVYCPVLDDEDGQEFQEGASCILTDPSFLEYNIFKEQTVEMKRDVPAETTEFYFRYKGKPSLYLNGAYTVTAKITADEKESIQESSRNRPLITIAQEAPATPSGG